MLITPDAHLRYERLGRFYDAKTGDTPLEAEMRTARHRYVPMMVGEFDEYWRVYDTAYKRLLDNCEVDALSDIELMHELVA